MLESTNQQESTKERVQEKVDKIAALVGIDNITQLSFHLKWSQAEVRNFLESKVIPKHEFFVVNNNGKLESELNGDKTNMSVPLVKYHFTQSMKVDAYSTVLWQERHAIIKGVNEEVIFEQKNVMFPETWSDTAVNVVASKYFSKGEIKEDSLKQMVDRVVNTIVEWGLNGKYFKDGNEKAVFANELKYIIINQMATFNSPVWFNIGRKDRLQTASACHILQVEDSMPGILEWYRQEGMIFSAGAGSGVNISSLRAEGEPISKGGVSSGPLSFARAADASAFSIKSGGTTRRSARMLIMDVDHPDILKFIWSKAKEEEKARVLGAAGYDKSLDGEIYATVAHQNCNMSVRVDDDFMFAVLNDKNFKTKFRTGGNAESYSAKDVFRQIAEASWQCGDPGIQFDTTINKWHTCPNSGRIEATNPCGEFNFLNNTSCNLASLNLLKFLDEDGNFNIKDFKQVVDIMTLATDIIVGNAAYPTELLTENNKKYRTIGIGYNNLGGLLMAMAIPYDSDEGRDVAGSITALMTGEAYLQSARIARRLGAFPEYEKNKAMMLQVIDQHLLSIPSKYTKGDRWYEADVVWKDARTMGGNYGYRNAQVSLLQPGGTVSIMMDCVTTGIEPDVALVNYKSLVGGGVIKRINPLVPVALRKLGYSEQSVKELCEFLERKGSFDDIYYSFIPEDKLSIFDCAFPTKVGGRAISWQGHVKMLAAVQPFLSGSASKTINMPEDSTVQDIMDAYMMAWELGCKSIAIYRDNCKQTQVLNVSDKKTGEIIGTYEIEQKPLRRHLPDTRKSITHKFSISGHEGYFTVGMFEDGSPGELFIKMSKEGSTISGLMDSIGILTSLCLQYSIPLDHLVQKFRNMRFQPEGFTSHPNIKITSSIMDFIFRWLEETFTTYSSNINPINDEYQVTPVMINSLEETFDSELQLHITSEDANRKLDYSGQLCSECGGITQRSGSCFVCTVCGTSNGCA